MRPTPPPTLRVMASLKRPHDGGTEIGPPSVEKRSKLQQDPDATDLENKEERRIREERKARKVHDHIETLRSLLREADFPVDASGPLSSCDRYVQELVSTAHGGAGGSNSSASRSGGSSSCASRSGGPSRSRRKQARKALQGGADPPPAVFDVFGGEFKASYEHIVESSDLPIAIATADGQLLRANRKFHAATGYTAADVAGDITLFSLAAPEHAKQLFAAVSDSLVGEQTSKRAPGRPQVVLVQGKDGAPLHMNISAIPPPSRPATTASRCNLLCCAILPEDAAAHFFTVV